MDTKGYYSLVQFSPDLSRCEAVNVGIVLYSPSDKRTAVRLLRTNEKVKKFFGKQDWSFITYSKEALGHRLQREVFDSREELQQFISKRANAIQMTELQSIGIEDIDKDADRLFAELVIQLRAPRRKRIDRTFGELLLKAGVRGLVQQSVQVSFPHFEEPLRAPFGFQNGRFNLLTPVELSADLRQVIAKVGEKAVEGELLYKNPDPHHGELRLNVVAKFSDELSDQSRDLVRTILTEHQVHLYSLDNLDPLVREIKIAADDHGILNQN